MLLDPDLKRKGNVPQNNKFHNHINAKRSVATETSGAPAWHMVLEVLGGGSARATGSCGWRQAAGLGEQTVVHALVTREEHSHPLTVKLLASHGPLHFVLAAVLNPVAVLEGLTRPRVVDRLAHRVATRQRLRTSPGHRSVRIPPRSTVYRHESARGLTADYHA